MNRLIAHLALPAAGAHLLLAASAALSAGADIPLRMKPRKFDLHEITLSGNGSVANPFDTVATVRFTPLSGAAKAVTVQAFHDGDHTWRARVYARRLSIKCSFPFASHRGELNLNRPTGS